jgi:hypothetical protein
MAALAGFSISEALMTAPGLIRDMYGVYLKRNGYGKGLPQ